MTFAAYNLSMNKCIKCGKDALVSRTVVYMDAKEREENYCRECAARGLGLPADASNDKIKEAWLDLHRPLK